MSAGCKDRWIRRHWEFQTVYREGIKQVGKRVILYALSREAGANRFGIAVTRRVGNAVVRNRVKRRIREVIRKNTEIMGEGMDLVVVARKNIVYASFDQIENEIVALVQKRSLYGRNRRLYNGEKP